MHKINMFDNLSVFIRTGLLTILSLSILVGHLRKELQSTTGLLIKIVALLLNVHMGMVVLFMYRTQLSEWGMFRITFALSLVNIASALVSILVNPTKKSTQDSE